MKPGTAFPPCARWGACLLLVLLAACGPTRELAQRATPGPTPPARFSAMQYFSWLGEAGAGDLRRELERLEAEWPRASAVDKTQLALLLSVSRLSDEERMLRARQILQSLVGETVLTQRSRDYLALAELWRSVLLLRDNLGSAALDRDTARQDLDAVRREAEDLRARLAAADELAASSEHRAAELEAQNRALKKQIEALTTIEQQLIEREQSQSP